MPSRRRGRMPHASVAAALGQQLKYARKAAQFPTQAALAASLKVDDTLIAKAESGSRAPTEPLYKAWMDECGIGGQLRSALDALWILARNADDPLSAQMAPWDETEAEAHTLRYWAPILIPGFVQTADYARTLFVGWGHSKDRVEELVAKRMERRSILDRPDPPDVTIIVWDRVLTTLIGSEEIMRDQLKLLLEISERPNVHIQILPSSASMYRGLVGNIDLATTDTTEVLLREGFSEHLVTADIAQVRGASAIFSTVRSDALPQGESQAALLKAMEAWNTTIRGASPRTAPPAEVAGA